jgi:hypothetical protein
VDAEHMMRLLDYLAEVFIGTFGITQPQPENRRMVSIALGGFILLGLLGGFAIVVFFLYTIKSNR